MPRLRLRFEAAPEAKPVELDVVESARDPEALKKDQLIRRQKPGWWDEWLGGGFGG